MLRALLIACCFATTLSTTVDTKLDQQQARALGAPSSYQAYPFAIAQEDKAVEAERSASASDDAANESGEYWSIAGHRLKITDSLLAAFTALLVLFTGGLVWIGRRQNQHFRQVERAFVSVRFNITPTAGVDNNGQPTPPTGVAVAPVWINSGNTPTRRMLTRSNRYLGAVALGSDFDFRDNQAPPGAPNALRPTLIAPKSEIQAQHFEFSNAQLADIANGRAFAYLWGWADYDDLFSGSKRHRTEYCNQLIVLGGAPEVGWSIAMAVHEGFNGMDGECLRKPAPWRK